LTAHQPFRFGHANQGGKAMGFFGSDGPAEARQSVITPPPLVAILGDRASRRFFDQTP
jgi:hypothetical protein